MCQRKIQSGNKGKSRGEIEPHSEWEDTKILNGNKGGSKMGTHKDRFQMGTKKNPKFKHRSRGGDISGVGIDKRKSRVGTEADPEWEHTKIDQKWEERQILNGNMDKSRVGTKKSPEGEQTGQIQSGNRQRKIQSGSRQKQIQSGSKGKSRERTGKGKFRMGIEADPE